MSYWDMGLILVLFIISYGLFKIGETLSESYRVYTSDWESFLWIVTIIFPLLGLWYLSKENPIGFLGFIPIITYILLKMSDSLGVEIQEKIKKFIYSIIFSSLYFLANHLFDIKITLPSLIVFAITFLLGVIGLLTA